MSNDKVEKHTKEELEKLLSDSQKQVASLTKELDQQRRDHDKLITFMDSRLALLSQQTANTNKDLSDAILTVKGNSRHAIEMRRTLIASNKINPTQFAQSDLIT